MDHRLTVVKPQLYFPWLQMPNENINIINTEHLTNNEKHWEKIISDRTISEHNHIKQVPNIFEPIISQKTTQHNKVIQVI